MAVDARRFSAQLRREAEEFTDGQFRDFRTKLVLEALNMISELSPVDTGYFRSSNLPFVGSPEVRLPTGPTRATFGQGADPSVLAEADGLLALGSPYADAGVATNVVYAPALEAGHSPQSSHMYARTALALRDVVEGP